MVEAEGLGGWGSKRSFDVGKTTLFGDTECSTEFLQDSYNLSNC
jgi:hypothetical protein